MQKALGKVRWASGAGEMPSTDPPGQSIPLVLSPAPSTHPAKGDGPVLARPGFPRKLGDK